MRHIVNGKIVELSTQADGSLDADALRNAAGIDPNRAFVVQMPDGSNRVVNPGERLSAAPDQCFTDAPKHKRGGRGQHQLTRWAVAKCVCRKGRLPWIA